MSSPRDFIPLDRTFRTISREVKRDAYDPEDLPLVGEPLSWHDLLQHPRVVVLAEAGAGKTWEIREVARRLRAEGKAAFFVRLEDAARDFENAFEEGSFEGFETWLAGSEDGWLLLDSVDEARLRSHLDFATAIRRVGRQLERAIGHAHVVITSRPHAWRANTDLAHCEHHLGHNPKRDTAQREPDDDPEVPLEVKQSQSQQQLKGVFTIVTLGDLSRGQVETFATARGVADVRAFMDAVERADAQPFTARPQDLQELVEFWKENGRISTRLELMKTSVRRRLQEMNRGQAEINPLPLSKAEIGARLVAAACTLARTATIQVPSGDATPAAGIALEDLLPDWNPRDHTTLLARPVFDQAIYGAVRFHHRSVREYLCARWFAELLDQQTSRRRIEQVLFRQQYGIEVIVPETRPILSWLSIFNDDICTRVERLAPEVFFEGGDPSALRPDVRRRILRNVVQLVANGASPWALYDGAAVARFATAELTNDIRILVEENMGRSDVLGLLLRMVWHGKLVGVLPEAKAIALNPTADHYVRIAAFRAVQTAGTATDMDDVRRAFALEGNDLDRSWIAELVPDLPETADGMAWLLEVIGKAEPCEPYNVDHLSHAVDVLLTQLPENLLTLFVNGALNLLEQPPVVEVGHCELSQRFGWLLRAASTAVLKIVEQRSTTALKSSALEILRKIPFVKNFGRGDGIDLDDDVATRLATLIHAWPELKWALFWRHVENERQWLNQTRGERLTAARLVLWSSFVRFDASDFELALDAVRSRSNLDDRLIALDVAFNSYVGADRPRAMRRRMKQVASGTPELAERLSSLLKPPRLAAQSRNARRAEAAWRRTTEAGQQKLQIQRAESKRFLAENLETHVRSPMLDSPDGITQAQAYLLQQAQHATKDSSQFARNVWRALVPEFEEKTALAFRDGAVAYWRRRRPTLGSEGAPLNTIDTRDIFGLVGLSIEASETSEWVGSLSEGEAEIAFRYAMHELNGFPPWLPQLHERFPDLIRDLALVEIRFELANESVEDSNYLLYDVSWSGQWLWNGIAPQLLQVLDHTSPKSLQNLRYALTVVQGSSLSDESIAHVAAPKALHCDAHDQAAIWFAVWSGVAPEEALPALQARLEGIADRSEAINFAMVFVSQLVGTQSIRSAARHAYRTPGHLKDLYLLIGRYVSEVEDIRRAGTGVYYPGLRDAAQDARNKLFSMLRDLPGKEAFVAMMQLAELHPDPSMRACAHRYALERAEKDSTGKPWAVQQVWQFSKDLERTPKTHRELFDLAVMRVQDLKDDLENGDASDAPFLLEVDEKTLRNFLGNRLRDNARGRYSLAHEDEFADAKRVDLRFHAPGIDAPVPLELKLSHNWTGNELLERLENQLCGDYLRDNRSTRGLFVLVHQGKQETWLLPNGSGRVDFDGLVRALANHWAANSHRFQNVEEIQVCGIDLTKRSARRESRASKRATRRSCASASRSGRRSDRRHVPSAG